MQAFELNRDDEYNLFYLAENYIKEGSSTPALQLYMKIVEKNNNNAIAHEKIGDILYRKGDYRGAINSYMSGMKVSRKHTHLYNKIASYYYDKYKKKEKLTNLLNNLLDKDLGNYDKIFNFFESININT